MPPFGPQLVASVACPTPLSQARGAWPAPLPLPKLEATINYHKPAVMRPRAVTWPAWPTPLQAPCLAPIHRAVGDTLWLSLSLDAVIDTHRLQPTHDAEIQASCPLPTRDALRAWS